MRAPTCPQMFRWMEIKISTNKANWTRDPTPCVRGRTPALPKDTGTVWRAVPGNIALRAPYIFIIFLRDLCATVVNYLDT